MENITAMHRQLLLFIMLSVLAISARTYAEEMPTYPMEPVTVQSTAGSKQLIGPYNQPRWSARGRFSTDTEVYVIPPGLFYIDLDYLGTISRHDKNVHLFTQEFELGLPCRFQIAYENNFDARGAHTQVTVQTIEARYALADWEKIPLNPTLFAEYHVGVGKDYERQEDPGWPVPHIPDSYEMRLLLGEQLTKKFQWALNIFHEQEIGGDRESETGFSQALSYAIHDEYLTTGMEMQFIRRTDAESRSDPQYEFDLGPSVTWKPRRRTRMDLAALLGTTGDSPKANLFAVFSFFFGKGAEEAEVSEPVSTKHR